LRHATKIQAESLKIIGASFLGGIFILQNQIPEKYDRPAVDTPATLTTPVLSTVFEMTRWSIHCYGPTVATLLYSYFEYEKPRNLVYNNALNSNNYEK
jgi:hypothetical protein